MASITKKKSIIIDNVHDIRRENMMKKTKYLPIPVDEEKELFRLKKSDFHGYDTAAVSSDTLDLITDPKTRSIYNKSYKPKLTFKDIISSQDYPIPTSIPLPPKGTPYGSPSPQLEPTDSNISGYMILKTLITGEDAVRYFATSNGEGPLKFVYCIRETNTEQFHPFNLVVVDQTVAESSNEHYTISSKGVVVVSEYQQSEFFTLSEWMKFSTIFHILTSMKFFKYFLYAKNFDTWRANVRYKLFENKRKKLSSNLFVSKVAFSSTLLSIKSQLYEIKNIPMQSLIPIQNHKYFDYSTFTESQANVRGESTKSFEVLMEKLQIIMEKVCNDVTTRTRNWEGADSLNPYNNEGKSRSMQAIRLEQEELERAHKQAIKEGGMLGNFIRLVDYIVVSQLITLLKHTFIELKDSLTVNLKTAFVETSVSYHLNEEGLFFSPSFDSYKTMFSQHIDSCVTLSTTVLRFIYTRPFNQFISNINEGPKVPTIIKNWTKYVNTVSAVTDKIEEDIQQCLDYAKIFESWRNIWDFQKQWDFNDFISSYPGVDTICTNLDKLIEWEKDIDRKIKVGQIIGMYFVESRKLKNSLTPITSSAIQELKEYLLTSGRENCNYLVDEFKKRIQLVTFQSQNLKEFASLVETYNKQKEELQELIEKSKVVEKIFLLFDEYKVEKLSADKILLEDMTNLRTMFQEELDKCSLFIEDRLSEMKTQLDMNVAKLKDVGEQIRMGLNEGVYIDPESPPDVVLTELDNIKKKLEQQQDIETNYYHYQKLFGVPSPDKKYLDEARSLFERVYGLWTTTDSWNNKQVQWLDKELIKVDVEQMNKEVQQFYLDAHSYNKHLNNDVSKRLYESVKEFKKVMPIILDLGNPNMRERHWKQLFKVINKVWLNGLKFSLQDLIVDGVLEHSNEVQEISGSASGEAQLEASLEKIKQGWSVMNFTVLFHRDQKDLLILGSLDEIFTLLEDNQVTLQTMMGSRFIVGIKSSVEVWEHKLNLLSETLDEWVSFQKNWMYLETIFSAEDIQKQLPNETAKFQIVDKHWRETMRKTRNYPLVLNCIEGKVGKGSDLVKLFKRCNEIQEEVLKSLEDYLETKRRAFPRFYFLSNDELLAILSQTREPQAVQPHLQKCFDGICHIDFGEGQNKHDMLAMDSIEGEKVAFSESVHADTNVEFWLGKMEAMMRKTLFDQTKLSFNDYPAYDKAIDRSDWLFKYPSNCILTVDQIIWCNNCTNSIQNNSLRDFYSYSCKQIDSLVTIVRGEPSKIQRMLLENLVTIDVHARDCVNIMIMKNVSSLNDFEWTKQLRYYWEIIDNDENCYIKQTNACFKYGYEYLGCVPRLVITPLTDQCYLTLTGALHLKFGGAPAGPAGTGKTETVKDLAKALARQCVVFNCSDGLDYKIMGRFFSGLSQAGAWSCFDEFNRIDIEVLSVIAQQILTIQQAIMKLSTEFEFEGRIIPLNNNFGVFITMNPGYAGRTELPDNLKALFRPVAMMVPDYRLIAEIILFSQGFTEATALANKMVQLYKLSSEQLSKQDHYDFGMRAVKSVLVAAGQLKRKERDCDENILLIRAMRDSNVPKFLSHDLPLFMGIVKDLFPGVDVPYVDYGLLQTQIESELENKKLQKIQNFILKIIQIHETQLIRHGLMVVGEAGCGKTTAITILGDALTSLKKQGIIDKDEMYQICKRYTLNPKSITMSELYGESNLLTKEWKDGLIATLVRHAISDISPNRKWIIFDGPVDALWIENMNTVLDDNKTLCLANSERIKLSSAMHMMFEVEDLAVASPATVSRCGMIYMEQVHLGVLPLIETWSISMEDIIPNHIEKVKQQLVDNIESIIIFVNENCKQIIQAKNMNLSKSCLNLIKSLIKTIPYNSTDSRYNRIIDLIVIFSLIWSFGANINDMTRPVFSEYIVSKFPQYLLAISDVYDYCVDMETTTFVQWDTQKKEFKYDPLLPYFNILVPTADSTRSGYLLKVLCTNGLHTLLIGETGVGKSVIIQDLLNELSLLETYCSTTVNFSAQTSSHNLLEIFESKLESKRKTLLGPPGLKKMLMFIDDLNMPQLDRYFSQPPCELLRQVIDMGGLYDLKKLFFKKIADVTFVTACAPPGGGRNKVTNRLLRHFHMIWLTQLSDSSLKTIFSSIFGGFIDFKMNNLLSMVDPLVSAAIYIYLQVQKELLPTPSKSHYTFNLRDLSKVFQGILKIYGVLPDNESLQRLWIHEECRVFRDRMTNDKDRNFFDRMIGQRLKKDFNSEIDINTFTDILFGDYLDMEEKKYIEIKDIKNLNNVMSDYLEEYNINHSNQMHLVFFDDAISHISRISRILSQRRGNALLVGVGGSGRKSLTRLASFIAKYNCFSVEITKSYGITEWHDDLKKALITAGSKNQPAIFLFSDTQIVKESFLEDINNLLNSGDIPNLYEPDEIESILNDVRPLAKEANIFDTKDNLFSYYIHLIRENLHIVLTFSPIGETFRSRCRQFPSLVNCCTIDWYDPWPEDALFSVANKFLLQNEDLGVNELINQLCKAFVYIHKSVEDKTKLYYTELGRHNYTTPTSYLELITLYIDMLKSQKDVISGKIDRYSGGLKKLDETNSTVKTLQDELTRLKPILEKAAKDTKELLETLVVDQKVADENRAKVKKEEEETQLITINVKKLKDECQLDLDEALPAYYSALKALESLDKKHIQEMKSFAKPPQLVQVVMEAVLTLLDEKTDWGEAKRVLGDLNFLDRLKDYDKDNINPKIIMKVQKYVKNPEFHPDKIKTVSVAATSLCMWVLAMNVYDRVARNIAPKKAKLSQAEEQYNEAQKALLLKQAELKKEEEKIKELKLKYENSLARQDNLEKEKAISEARLGRAGKLIYGLGDEKERWTQSLTNLNRDMENVVGNILLSTGCIAYSGPFTSEYRKLLCNDWIKKCILLNLPVDKQFSISRILSDPVKVREWNIMGLPADDFSTENGLYSDLCRRWPLMIDPQGQANRWIKNMEKEKNLQVMKLSETNFLRTLENAIRYGMPALIENAEEELDPVIEPVLLKQIFKKGGQWLLHLGDSDVPYSNEFKLFITTKLSNPHYMPEVCIKVTIINFTVTMKGLEDQLLVNVVKEERPDLEEKKDQCILSISNDQKQLKSIEDKILHMLANSTGNILDDEELISNLGASKQTSQTIGDRMKEAENTTREINQTRELYRPVATRGSILYFVLCDLANVDSMYQYSLQYFVKIYIRRIQLSTKSSVLSERINILINDLTYSIFQNVSRGLFEKDKLLFAFLISVKILLHQKMIDESEWMSFLIGAEVNKDNEIPDKIKHFVTDKIYSELLLLTKFQPFGDIIKDIENNIDSWVNFSKLPEPHKSKLPEPYETNLNSFRKMMLLKAFHPEKIIFAAGEFIGKEMGEKFRKTPPLNLDDALLDSRYDTPIIFILSAGADPIPYLFKLAETKSKDKSLKIISLGQGQGPIAEAIMKSGRQDGDWICLQNCHLAVSWLPQLEKILENVESSNENVHNDYRLWLTSMPSNKFPVSILQSGIKLTQEPPQGIRANINRTFHDITNEEYESCNKPRPYKKLLFGLAFYHAICLERRKFGAIGWNIPYGWMNSDLKTGMMQVKMYIEEQEHIPYETLNALVGDISYGGRITDYWDKRTNVSILRKYFTIDIMDDNYKFSDGDIYFAPKECTLDHIREYIDQLPLIDKPDIFGLHENADITFQEKETKSLLSSILLVQPKSSNVNTSGKTADEEVEEFANNIETNLPCLLTKENCHELTFASIEDGSVNSLGVFCEQEMIRFNKLIEVIRDSIKSLKKAIKGLVVMSSQLEEVYNCFRFKKVPKLWESAGYPSLKPLGSWILDLYKRIIFISKWIVNGPPITYWISGFFFPQGFVTGMLQSYSRKTHIAIDTLKINTIVTNSTTDDITNHPDSGLYIYGLYMQGARWDRFSQQMSECIPGILFDELPCIQLLPVESDDFITSGRYECPVYKTSLRAGELSTTGHSTNFILPLHLKTDKSSDHWIRRGTALLCQLDE